jgi:flagellar hook assembly protein FlgD
MDSETFKRLGLDRLSVLVSLRIYNALGQEVRELLQESLPPGLHEVVWDARDGHGREISSGVYFSRLHGGGASQVRRMLLVR